MSASHLLGLQGPQQTPAIIKTQEERLHSIILSNLVYDWMDTWIAAQCSGLDSLMRRHRSGKMHWYKGWGSSFSKSSWSFCTCTCTCLFSARIWHSSSRWRSLQVHVSAAVRVHNGSWHRWHLDYKEEYKTSSHLAWADFRIKVKQIAHSIVQFDQWNKLISKM